MKKISVLFLFFVFVTPMVWGESKPWPDSADEISVVRIEKITTREGYSNPVWLPDGQRILVSHGPEIVLMNTDGSNRKVVVSDCQENFSLSSDGSTIVYNRRPDGYLWIVDIDGENKKELVDFYVYSPLQWAPNGNMIAFVLEPYIYIVSPDGLVINKIQIGDKLGFELTWSSDSAKISFGMKGRQFIMHNDGSNKREIGPGGFSDQWSPNNQCILLNYGGIKLIPTDGSGEKKITSDYTLPRSGRKNLLRFVRVEDPVWFPNSNIIIASETVDNGEELLSSNLFAINIDGSGKKMLTNTPDYFEFHAKVSPDGTKIVYQTDDFSGDIVILELTW